MRIWPKDLKFSKSRIRTKENAMHTEVVEKLLKAGIISRTLSANFLSSFFTIKSKDKIRPIFNYSHLTNAIVSPKFNLPSIYQLLMRENWDKDLFFLKLDFSRVFISVF